MFVFPRVTIGFDRFGIQGLVGAPMDEERISTLLQLLELGYENQIMLSYDSINDWVGWDPVMNDEVTVLVQNWHPIHVFENIVPRLKENGAADAVIEELFHFHA